MGFKETFTLIDKNVNEKNIALKFVIELDIMKIFLIKKGSDGIQRILHEKQYTVTMDSKLEDIVEDFYSEYLDRKSVENYWRENLKFDGGIIEVNFDVED